MKNHPKSSLISSVLAPFARITCLDRPVVPAPVIDVQSDNPFGAIEKDLGLDDLSHYEGRGIIRLHTFILDSDTDEEARCLSLKGPTPSAPVEGMKKDMLGNPSGVRNACLQSHLKTEDLGREMSVMLFRRSQMSGA